MKSLEKQHEQREKEHETACRDMEVIISEAKTPELKIRFEGIVQAMKQRKAVIDKWSDELTCTPDLCFGYPPQIRSPLNHPVPCPIRSQDCPGAVRSMRFRDDQVSGLMKDMRISKDGIRLSKEYEEFRHITGLKTQWEKAYLNGQAFIITGTCGSGKTIAACILTRLFLQRRYDQIENNKTELRQYGAGYWSLKNLLMYIDSKKYEERPAFIEYLSRLRFLVLDDIGSLPDPKRYIPMILDEREGNHLFTVITTNIDMTEWPQVFGERTASRMLGDRWSIPVQTSNEKLRLKPEKAVEYYEENLPL